TGGTSVTAGTLTLANTAALGAAGAAVTMSGGSLDLATNTSVNAYNLTLNSNTSVNAYNLTLNGSASVVSDRATAGAGITHTLGTLTMNGATLAALTGSNVTSGTAGVTFGATTLTTNGNMFDGAANLTLGSLSGNFNFTTVGSVFLNS